MISFAALASSWGDRRHGLGDALHVLLEHLLHLLDVGLGGGGAVALNDLTPRREITRGEAGLDLLGRQRASLECGSDHDGGAVLGFLGHDGDAELADGDFGHLGLERLTAGGLALPVLGDQGFFEFADLPGVERLRQDHLELLDQALDPDHETLALAGGELKDDGPGRVFEIARRDQISRSRNRRGVLLQDRPERGFPARAVRAGDEEIVVVPGHLEAEQQGLDRPILADHLLLGQRDLPRAGGEAFRRRNPAQFFDGNFQGGKIPNRGLRAGGLGIGGEAGFQGARQERHAGEAPPKTFRPDGGRLGFDGGGPPRVGLGVFKCLVQGAGGRRAPSLKRGNPLGHRHHAVARLAGRQGFGGGQGPGGVGGRAGAFGQGDPGFLDPIDDVQDRVAGDGGRLAGGHGRGRGGSGEPRLQDRSGPQGRRGLH